MDVLLARSNHYEWEMDDGGYYCGVRIMDERLLLWWRGGGDDAMEFWSREW